MPRTSRWVQESPTLWTREEPWGWARVFRWRQDQWRWIIELRDRSEIRCTRPYFKATSAKSAAGRRLDQHEVHI